jgi:hypothetical protein
LCINSLTLLARRISPFDISPFHRYLVADNDEPPYQNWATAFFTRRRPKALPTPLNEKFQEVSMRNRLGFLSVSFFALSLLSCVNFGFAAQPPDQTGQHIEDELIVKFRGGRDDYSKLMTHYGVGARRAKVFSKFSRR